MNAFEWFLLWSAVSIAWGVVEVATEDGDVRMIPRCVRCSGMRDFGHRCTDAVEGGEIVVDT